MPLLWKFGDGFVVFERWVVEGVGMVSEAEFVAFGIWEVMVFASGAKSDKDG